MNTAPILPLLFGESSSASRLFLALWSKLMGFGSPTPKTSRIAPETSPNWVKLGLRSPNPTPPESPILAPPLLIGNCQISDRLYDVALGFEKAHSLTSAGGSIKGSESSADFDSPIRISTLGAFTMNLGFN